MPYEELAKMPSSIFRPNATKANESEKGSPQREGALTMSHLMKPSLPNEADFYIPNSPVKKINGRGSSMRGGSTDNAETAAEAEVNGLQW